VLCVYVCGSVVSCVFMLCSFCGCVCGVCVCVCGWFGLFVFCVFAGCVRNISLVLCVSMCVLCGFCALVCV